MSGSQNDSLEGPIVHNLHYIWYSCLTLFKGTLKATQQVPKECPNEAIEENDPVYNIDPDRCTECVGHFDEPQCIAVCPVDCIVPDPDNVENVEELKFKYDKLQEEE